MKRIVVEPSEDLWSLSLSDEVVATYGCRPHAMDEADRLARLLKACGDESIIMVRRQSGSYETIRFSGPECAIPLLYAGASV